MNGKLPSVMLKILAVVSAIAIGGGYVAYKEAEAQKAKQREQAEREKAKAEEFALIVGSKSIAMPIFTKEARDLITPIQDDKAILPPLLDDEVLLPSSKIGIIRMPEIITEEKEEELRKLLPGSKSPNFILENPQRKKSE